uniref:uncharacterized protein LOC120343927 n=1 Tax=Styela clava TaxID=7725 RepID=UPI00193A8470|nr:uncharacterized protein LOC120343927 [Styela clava]
MMLWSTLKKRWKKRIPVKIPKWKTRRKQKVIIRPASGDMGNELLEEQSLDVDDANVSIEEVSSHVQEMPKSFVEKDYVKGPVEFVDSYWQLSDPSDNIFHDVNAHSNFDQLNETCAEDGFGDDRIGDMISTTAQDENRECNEKTIALWSQSKEKHDYLPILIDVSTVPLQGNIQIRMNSDGLLYCCSDTIVYYVLDTHTLPLSSYSTSDSGILACYGDQKDDKPHVSFAQSLPKMVMEYDYEPLSTFIMSMVSPLMSENMHHCMAVTYWMNLSVVASTMVMFSALVLKKMASLGITFTIEDLYGFDLPMEKLYGALLSDVSTHNAVNYAFGQILSTIVTTASNLSMSKNEFLSIDAPIKDLHDSKTSNAGTLISVVTYWKTSLLAAPTYKGFFPKFDFNWWFCSLDVKKNDALSMFKHKDNKQLDLANERILRKIGVSDPAGKVMLQLSSLVPYTLQRLVDGNDTNETKKQSGSKGQQSGSKQKQPQQTNGSFSYGTSASNAAGGGRGEDEDEDGKKRRRIQDRDFYDDDSDNDDSDEEKEEREETSNPGSNSRDEEKSASSSENPQISDSADITPSPIHLGLHANEINDGASTSRGTNAEIPIEEVDRISERPISIQVQRQANPDQPARMSNRIIDGRPAILPTDNGSLNTFGHKTRFNPDHVRTVESDGPQPPPPPPVQSPPTNRVNESNGTSVRRNELPDFEQQMLGTLPGVRGLFAELPWTSRNEDERLQPTSQPDRLQLGPQSRDYTFTLRSERQENGHRIETWRWIPTTSACGIASIHPNRQERPGRADMRESRRCPDCNEEILGIFTYCRNCARHICGLCWISHDCQRWF